MLRGPSRTRARGVLYAREGRDVVSDRGSGVNSEKVLIDTLENELASIRGEMARLSVKEAAIKRTIATYTGSETPVIRATREMNTVDMARTVIRNAGLA